MPLITPYYFTGDLQIAGLTSEHVRNRVQAFIDKYEPDFLRKLFGRELYTGFAAGIIADPVLSHWTALLYGDADWPGLIVRPEITVKKSMIANYVYFYYMRDNETITTGLGEAKPESQNSTQASSIHKQVRAWNEMVEQVHNLYRYLDMNNALYLGWQYNYRFGYYEYARFIRNPFRPINTLNL